MKYMIASDIHGSTYYFDQLMTALQREQPQGLILLGDLLYHGPRNSLPRNYDPKEVFERLNSIADQIICVRGNCDTEVDQMVLEFPIMADYALITLGDRTIYATHGHIWGEDKPPLIAHNHILLCGHTHIPACNHHDTFTYWNPGSVSIPKGGSANSYMTVDETTAQWKDLDGNVFMQDK